MDAKVKPAYVRAAEDIGNIILLEHVNVTHLDQRAATLFYVGALGGTRDPYLHVLDNNMWVNFGRQQFHMPTRPFQVLRGRVGIVVPELDAVRARMTAMTPRLEGSKFKWSDAGVHIDATCPWGNQIRVHAAGERFGRMRLGIPYVEFDVPRGSAEGIVKFYQRALLTIAHVERDAAGAAAHVSMGVDQECIFRETDAPIPDYDGHHIAIYVANFSGPHDWLDERGLITEESDPWQYRFIDIVDPDTRTPLFKIEHEVRSLTHPMYGRPLMNRNPAQQQMGYSPGHDTFY